MSHVGGTLRWMTTSLVLAIVSVVTLMVVGEVYGGTDIEVGSTVDGEPAVEDLVGPQSGADVRNASVALGLLGLSVLVATYFYFRHTGRAARRRHREARRRQAQQAAETTADGEPDGESDGPARTRRVEPWLNRSTSSP